ncbi:MAG TPA: MFS transporter [Marmoricola sp.]|nr:MFS transporter [Marmoricola sp.]
MSGTAAAGSYVHLLRRPAVARTFVPALVGRLAYGVLPLSLLFTVQHATGSFSTAATAMALNGLAALSMPMKSRAIDRYGQRLVIPLITSIIVVVLLVATAMAHAHVTSALAWLASGLAVGVSSPPLGPSMRAQWRALVPQDLIAGAYSLDAVAEETLYVLGPMIASGTLAFAPAYTGLVACTVLLGVGAAGLASSPAAGATPNLRQQGRAGGPLRHVRFLRLLLAMGAVGAVTATIYTVTAARALATGHPSLAGLADAGVAVGSVVGGLLWGRVQPAWASGQSLSRLLALIGAAALIASAANPYWLFAAALAVGGLAISPIFVVAYQTTDRLVAPAEITEASTWVNTVTNLGISSGGAASGFLVSHVGARAPGWAGAILALALASAIAGANPRPPRRPREITHAPLRASARAARRWSWGRRRREPE